MFTKPTDRPSHPGFSSGPCAKRPGWTPDVLESALTGRSHRSPEALARLKVLRDKIRSILDIPDNFKIGITAGSDSGAVEMAMWNMLGPRGVDIFVWDHFSGKWADNAARQLKLADLNIYENIPGETPDLSVWDAERDTVFAWNATTSGTVFPVGQSIPAQGSGLVICDATSAVMAYDIPYDQIDVTTWSWQKAIGGEAQHGVIIMSPKALMRLEEFNTDRPIPSILNLRRPDGTVRHNFFKGVTLNTPSLLCVEDAIDALDWIQEQGGHAAAIKRAQENYAILAGWVKQTDWIDFFVKDETVRSRSSVTLEINEESVSLPQPIKTAEIVDSMIDLLRRERAAFDLNSYRTMPAGFRIWCGTTVLAEDISLLTQWLEWSFHETLTRYQAQ